MRTENSDDEAAGSEQDLLREVIVLIDTAIRIVGPASKQWPGRERLNRIIAQAHHDGEVSAALQANAKRCIALLKEVGLVYSTPSAGTYVAHELDHMAMLREVVTHRMNDGSADLYDPKHWKAAVQHARLHGHPLATPGGSAACGTVTAPPVDDATAVKLYRKELLRLERTLPTHLLENDWSDREADWASAVQAATSAKALAACVVALQSHLILPSTAHLGSAHEGWGMSDVDDFCSFVEWWKKLLKALSKAGHAEAGAMAAVGTPNRSRSSKHHRAPPPSNLVAPKLADLVRLAVATLDDQREGDAETPLWRWDADEVSAVVESVLERLVSSFPNPVQFQELRQPMLGLAHEVRMREFIMKTLKDCELLRRVTSVDRRQYYEIAPQPEANDDLLTICFAGRGAGYSDRQVHAENGKRVVRSAHDGGGGQAARGGDGGGVGGSSKRIRRQEAQQQAVSYVDSDGAAEMEAVHHKSPPRHRRPPSSFVAGPEAASGAQRGRTSAEELHATAADSIDAVVALQELIAQSQRESHMQMEAFRTGMEEMATAVRSLAAQLRAGGAQQAPAAGDDVSDAEMQNLAATVQYVRDENAQAIAECKGEIGRLQRILAEYHAQRMRVLTPAPLALAAPAAEETVSNALQIHQQSIAQVTPTETRFGTMQLASEAEAIDAEEMGGEFAAGVRFAQS